MKCDQNKTKCFAYDGQTGICACLDNTRFKKECPFYKSKEEYEEGLRKYPHRYK